MPYNYQIPNMTQPVSEARVDMPNGESIVMQSSITSPWFNYLQQLPQSANTPTISSGNVPPITTPNKIGNVYLDLALQKVYISFGTSSSSDWILIN